MKIVIILGTRLNLGGGMEYYFKEFADFLNGRHEVTIVEAACGQEFTDLKKDFNSAKIITTGNRKGFDFPSLRDFLIFRKLFTDNDVVYYHSGAWNIIYCMFLQFLTRTPVVGIAWFLTDAKKRFNKENAKTGDSAKARFASWLFGPSFIKFGRFFKSYQVVSHEDFIYLSQKYGKKCHISEITFGIETSKYGICPKEKRFTILYLARLDYQKGADLLPELVTKLSTRLKEFNFYIVGDGPYYERIDELRKIYNNVQTFGYVSKQTDWDRYRNFLCSAHVFISPIRYAGTTIIALEALASGTPVVEFESTGTVERIREGYNGYMAKSKSEMIDRIIDVYKLWSAGSGYDELASNALISAKSFEQKDKFQQVEQLITETESNYKK